MPSVPSNVARATIETPDVCLKANYENSSAVKVKRPEERFAMSAADQAGGFQNRSHLLGRVDEDAKRNAPEPENEIPQREYSSDVPAVARMGKGKQAARLHGGGAKKRGGIGIATDDAVEGDNVRLWQQGGCRREVAEDESSGAGAVTRGDVTARNLKKGSGRVSNRCTGQPNGGEFGRNCSNARADIKKVEIVKWPAAQLG